MSTDIERLLYYERQYLGSFDFTAEQNYHLEMRRRLNINLHTWGIVEGLELMLQSPLGDSDIPHPEGLRTVVPKTIEQVYVSEGMAVDAYGREIIVPSKKPLSEFLDQNPVSGTGVYSVWIGYTREPSTPPAAGYRSCESHDQFTRWKEGFAIYLFKVSKDGPRFQEEPQRYDAPLDDPQKYPWLIHLGTVSVDKNLTIINPTNDERRYVGIRAQQIVAPRDATKEFAVLSKNAPLSPQVSVGVEANLFAEQNLIVGADFKVENIIPPPAHKVENIIPPPAHKVYPNPTGNVKIASDLFVQGNLYTQCDSAQPGFWLSLDQCIRQRIKDSVPETHIGTTEPILFEVTDDASHTFIATSDDVSVTTQLSQVATDPSPRIITSIAGVSFKAPRQTGTHDAQLAEMKRVHEQRASAIRDGLQIETFGTISPPSGNQYTLSLTCRVGPFPNLTADNLPVHSVKISYVVIFYPKT
jgi:hypothetical protein